MLGSAMQKIEPALVAVVIGLAFPFIVTYLVSGGASSSFLIPCTSAGSGVCTVARDPPLESCGPEGIRTLGLSVSSHWDISRVL